MTKDLRLALVKNIEDLYGPFVKYNLSDTFIAYIDGDVTSFNRNDAYEWFYHNDNMSNDDILNDLNNESNKYNLSNIYGFNDLDTLNKILKYIKDNFSNN